MASYQDVFHIFFVLFLIFYCLDPFRSTLFPLGFMSHHLRVFSTSHFGPIGHLMPSLKLEQFILFNSGHVHLITNLEFNLFVFLHNFNVFINSLLLPPSSDSISSPQSPGNQLGAHTLVFFIFLQLHQLYSECQLVPFLVPISSATWPLTPMRHYDASYFSLSTDFNIEIEIHNNFCNMLISIYVS